MIFAECIIWLYYHQHVLIMNLGRAESLTISLIKDGQAFDVQSLKFNSRLHQDYEIIAEVISSDTVHNTFAAQRCFTTGAWYQVLLCFAAQNKSMVLQGVCTELIGSGKYIHGQELQIITLRSELFPLFNNQRSGIYYGGNLLDIIDKGLIALVQDTKLTQHTEFVKNLTQDTDLAYPPQLSLTQYLEADMAFILRQMRQFGAWFNFYQALMLDGKASPANAPKVTATLGDTNAAFMRYPEQVNILDPAESQGKGIYGFEYSEGGTALGQIEGIYYDEISGKTLSGIAKIPDGQPYRKAQYILPHTALTQTQMQYQTQVVADSLAIRQKALEGYFQGLFIQAGQVINLNDETWALQGEYLLSQVSYHFSKRKEADKNIFDTQHHFQAYPLALPYREALLDEAGEPPALYRAPVYQGVMSGVFALTQGSQTVTPDALGSIPLWFPYHYWYTCKSAPCRYTRVISQANQGGKSGVSFPYYQDTEFVLMFVNGDLDRPVIKGTAANNLSGHLHNQSVQQRSALALSQGQHLLYSNVPEDQNFLKLGANHNEGTDETHMLLSNYPDPDMPGAKKLDYQQASTQSYERVTGTNFLHQAGGEQKLRTTDGKVPAKTYLMIQLGDQSNLAQPTNKPLLTDYLTKINLSAKINGGTDNDYSAQAEANYACKILVAANANDDAIANLNTVALNLSHSSASDYKTLAVSVIALNSKPMQPNNLLQLKSADWQNNKTTDAEGNVYYTVYLTLLPPPLLFNFRQGFYAVNNALPQDQQEILAADGQFFDKQTYSGKIEEQLSPERIAFYQAEGNNALIFIHGFHVIYGQYPCDFVMQPNNTLSIENSCAIFQNNAFVQSRYPGCTDAQLNDANLRYGTGAQNWLVCMEYNLNKAFGFDDQDYTKYTRIIGVTWQGDPASPVNYMAAIPMSDFSAQKVFGLIKQLTDAGIKVELMAHSLGNAILARTLDLCGKNGIQIQHAHLWQPAIPNNALDTTASTNYLPVLIPDSQGTEVNLPANYDYTHARSGAKEITVLFSTDDTILGPVTQGSASADNQALQQQEAADLNQLTQMTLLQKAFALLGPAPFIEQTVVNDGLNMWFAKHNATLWETIQDPGAGWSFAVPATIIKFMDDQGIKIGGTHQGMLSIYHMANLFRYPLGYIFEGTEEDLVTYYNDWKNKFKNFAVTKPDGGAVVFTAMKATVYEQAIALFALHPKLMSFAVSILNTFCLYKNSSNTQHITNAESDATQTKVTTDLTKIFALGVNGLIKLDFEKISSDVGESCKESILIATVLLTALLTGGAVPVEAMGYNGIPSLKEFFNYGFIDQKGTLHDHVAMLYPDADMMKKIYIDNLKNGSTDKRIDYFGKWRPA